MKVNYCYVMVPNRAGQGAKVFSAIRDEAKRRGVEVEASEIVGTIPLDAAVGVIKEAVNEPAFRMDQILEKRVWAAE